ncbi:MAG: hypothetical protein O7G88_01000 [bacterium]|nr:hypothetical protein [bacterium]
MGPHGVWNAFPSKTARVNQAKHALFLFDSCFSGSIFWEAVMGNNPSSFKGWDCPVERVLWEEVQQFIAQLNAREARGPGAELLDIPKG